MRQIDLDMTISDSKSSGRSVLVSIPSFDSIDYDLDVHSLDTYLKCK